MGIKQFQRGMRHRFKAIQIRLRRQVRHMARHGKLSKAIEHPCEAPPPCIELGQPIGELDTFDAPGGPASAPPLSYPTLRRRVDHGPAQ